MSETLEPENISAQDAAFAESEANMFLGRKLEPFSAMRRNAAQALGNRLFCGAVKIDSDDSGLYPGAMADAIIVLYLCCNPRNEVLLAFRKPDVVYARAMEWADSHDIAVGTRAGMEALEVYGDMLRQVSRSQFDLDHDPKAQGAAGEAARHAAQQ